MRKPYCLPLLMVIVTCWLVASPLEAAFSSCATSWSNFNNPGFISEYTFQGQVIADEETSADTSHGPAAVTPSWTDLASGSPSNFPGPEPTSYFGYYNGGTVYDPDDPITMEDDYILFRMRVEGDPSGGDAFDSKHWNVLFDVDGDGYKEYWVDLDGSFKSGPKEDRLQILFDNANRQNIPDPDAARVEVFTAYHTPDGDASCSGTSPGLSHTRSMPVGDGTGDYWIEMQIPMTAFNDANGNQVLYPDSPVAFVFSTGASNQDPLQKDFMHDLEFLTLADPITFGDIVIPNGRPNIEFTDADLNLVNYYTAGDNIYIYLTDPIANTDPAVVECVDVTVSDPATGDDESVTLCESGPSTGIFTNRGGTCKPAITNPNPAPSPPTAWLVGIRTSDTTITEDWTFTYVAATNDWIVTGSLSGVQSTRAAHGVAYSSDNAEVSFTIYQNGPAGGTVVSMCTLGADPLPSSTAAASDNDGTLEVVAGDDIFVAYTNPNFITVTDTVPILGSCDVFVSFTRATGLPSNHFELTPDPATSDRIYVTVFHAGANSNPAVAETIQVLLTGNDTQTLTLTETGPDTGEFRNTTGLQTKIDDGTVVDEDNLWEDVDLGTVTATYNYTCGGSPLSTDTQASLFFTGGGGRVKFTNGAGTLDVDIYGPALPVWLKVTDANACATNGTLQVTVTSDAGDSETITLYETFSGSGVYLNRENDLVTTAGSAIVTSASSTFLSDGVLAGDTFALAFGPDAGTYTVASVDSETQITLTAALTTSRTSVGFNAFPLMTATNDGTTVADDDILEADHDDTLTVSYSDCNDGDSDTSNDVKIDTAVYNAPSLMINEVLFYPDTAASSCQTEAVEIYNADAIPVTATGYSVSDEDTFNYTVPQLSGSDIVLQPGETIYLSLWSASPPNDFFLNGTYYLFTAAGSSFPSDRFADPDNADPADQISLFDSGGVVQDYVGWSSTLTNSLDFYSDDSPAVLRSIWQDDAFKNVTGIALASSMARTTDGFDTNHPSDWSIVSNNVCTIIATRAFISSFRIFREGGQMVAEWETSSESGTLGFYLFRYDPRAASYVRVNQELLPGLIDSPQGGIYRLRDRGANGNRLTYVLMEIESTPSGTGTVFHGPYSLSPDATGMGASSSPARGWGREERLPHAPALEELVRLEKARALRGRAATVTTPSAGADGPRGPVKIALKDAGVYALTSAELASLFDASQGSIESELESGRFRLQNRGRTVPWTLAPDGHALQFWGESIDSIYSDRNVYWLERTGGSRMKTEKADRRSRNPKNDIPAFWQRLTFEEDRFPATLVSTDPESDYWHWSYVIASHPVAGRQSFNLSAEGLAAVGGEAKLTVHLASATDTSAGTRKDHHIKVYLNGELVGETRWGGIRHWSSELTFNQELLREGENGVELEGILDSGAPFSIVYIDGFELEILHAYRASGPRFQFRAEGNSELTVGGFNHPSVQVFDITEPGQPKLLTGVQIEPHAGSYQIQFRSAPDGVYAAVTPAGVSAPIEIWRDQPSRWRLPSNGADYLVIAPGELAASSEGLARLRASFGHDTKVVLLEDVMDEFNDGLYSPHAVREFLSFAHDHWARPPRFAALVGAGNIDYKNNLGLGGNLLPPLMVATPNGLYASDNRFADVDGDGWPELAVGRIPVMTNEELEAYVAKLAAHEASGGSLRNEPPLLVADDDPWTGANFAADSESMAATLPPEMGAERIYLLELSPAEARDKLLSRLSAGSPFVSYVGHGGLDRLADEVLLHKNDVAALGNGERLTILAGFSCSINRFELSGFQSLGETLVIEPGGGAAAVWAPSGLSLDLEARALGTGFFSSVFEARAATLGEAILSSFDIYRRGARSNLLPQIYNLLGDPAVRLK